MDKKERLKMRSKRNKKKNNGYFNKKGKKK